MPQEGAIAADLATQVSCIITGGFLGDEEAMTAEEKGVEEQYKEIGFVTCKECHDFKWSRALWRTAAVKMSFSAMFLTVVYLTLAYLFATADDLKGVDIWYLYSGEISENMVAINMPPLILLAPS